MTEDWLQWTRENLERGCSREEIKGILKSNGFSGEQIDHAMTVSVKRSRSVWERLKQRIRPHKNKSVDTNSEMRGVNRFGAQKGLDYAALAKPALLQNTKLQKIDDESTQLYVLDGFLSRSECEAVIRQLNKSLRPSTITTGVDKSGFRTSSTCDLGHQDAKIIAKIDNKIARTLGLSSEWSEVIQGQKYEVGQEFKAHTDYFEPNSKEFKEFASQLGQRTWTFMVYLNSTEAGGATHFTELDQLFYPKAGRAVIWNNLLEDGRPNPATKHHGMPVEVGTKQIITKWFRDIGPGQPML